MNESGLPELACADLMATRSNGEHDMAEPDQFPYFAPSTS